MEDIELVIKINKDIAQGIIYGENDAPRNIVRAFQATIADAIKSGTPLPKGHGRLIDADDVTDFEGHYITTDAPTIIKADESEVKE